MAGFTINIPDPQTKSTREVLITFTLPSGADVIVYRGKGRDVRLALMAAGANADPFRILFAIIARVTTINGESITLESIEEMDMQDVLALQAEAGKLLSPLVKLKTVTAAPAQQDAPQEKKVEESLS